MINNKSRKILKAGMILIIAMALVMPSMIIAENVSSSSATDYKPNPPIGPIRDDELLSHGAIEVEYGFNATNIDIFTPTYDGVDVKFRFDWNDGTGITGWSEFVEYEEDITVYHTFAESGTFYVKVQAKKIAYGEMESLWSIPLEVIIMDTEPTKPSVSGPLYPSAEVGQHSTSRFFAVSSDEDGHKLQYTFDWGDSVNVTDFVDQGVEIVNATHTWTTLGYKTFTVIAEDESGKQSEESINLVHVIENSEPERPSAPQGPVQAKQGEETTYIFTGIDPNNDNVHFGIDWNGDRVIDEYSPETKSGEPLEVSHIFTVLGPTSIQFKTLDILDQESYWSPDLEIEVVEATDNHEPNRPTVQGEESPDIGIDYFYEFATIDPDDDDVKYFIDWGDGESYEETDFYESGLGVLVEHNFTDLGLHEVRTQAMDTYGALSRWSPILDVFVVDEQTPNTPKKPIGQDEPFIGEEYIYTFVGTDPNNDDLKYGIDWNGDEIVDQWSYYYESSGVPIEVFHTFNTLGWTTIKVKTNDSERESSWSPELDVNVVPEGQNHPPETPGIPVGPIEVEINDENTFTVVTTDPDEGDEIMYYVNWSDGEVTETNYFESGVSVEVNHIYTTLGFHEVTVQAQDNHGDLSELSSILDVFVYDEEPEDHAPTQPTITGPHVGGVNGELTYVFETTDEDYATSYVHFKIFWGDGAESSWISVSDMDDDRRDGNYLLRDRKHTYTESGTYILSAIAKDDNTQLVSEESEPFVIQITSGEPSKPIISGPTVVGGLAPTDFTFVSEDPDGHDLYYEITWGDGETTNDGPFTSSSTQSFTHTYELLGEYNIRAQSKDSEDLESELSDRFEIEVVNDNAPNSPILKGKLLIEVGAIVDFKALSTDDDGKQSIQYRFSDTENGVSDWTDFHPYDEPGKIRHQWDDIGTYEARAQARDEFGEMSDWGPTFTFEVTNETDIWPMSGHDEMMTRNAEKSPDSGNVIWEFKGQAKDIFSNEIIANGNVYFVRTYAEDEVENVTSYGIDAFTGELEWEHEFKGFYAARINKHATQDDVIVFEILNKINSKWYLAFLDALNGDVLYSTQLDVEGAYPIVYDGHYYTYIGQGLKIVSYDLHTGVSDDVYVIGSQVRDMMIIDGDMYVGIVDDDHYIIRIDLSTGTQTEIASSSDIDVDNCYGRMYSDGEYIYSLYPTLGVNQLTKMMIVNITTEETRILEFTEDQEEDILFLHQHPTIVDDKAFILNRLIITPEDPEDPITYSQGLSCYDISGDEPELLWREWTTSESVELYAPLVTSSDDKIYIRGSKVGIRCFDVDTGNELWSNDDITAGDLSIAYNMIYVSEGNTVYCIRQNDKPLPPSSISGPTTGDVNIKYTFTTSESSDPDGDDLLYRFDWGDDRKSRWSSLTSSSYKYKDVGEYEIKSQCRDIYGAESVWSSCTHRIIIGTTDIEITKVAGFPGRSVSAKIKNVGETEIDNLPWSISIKGGILGRIDYEDSGTIDIPLGSSVTIETEDNPVFGLGAVTVKVTAGDKVSTSVGILILRYIFILGVVD